MREIPLRVLPALTTPGKWMVCCAVFGTTLDENSRFDAPHAAHTAYFDSVADAVQRVAELNERYTEVRYAIK